MTHCPVCEHAFFMDHTEAPGPERFDYPDHCKSCRLNFFYLKHAYRLRILDTRSLPHQILFEGSFPTRDEMWSAFEQFEPIDHIALFRGPGWVGFTCCPATIKIPG